MPTLEVTVTIKRDGKELAGFPLVRRLTVQQVQDVLVEHADEGAQASLATDYAAGYNTTATAQPQLVYITADAAIRVHPADPDAASLYPIVLDANGFILAFGLSQSEPSNAAFLVCNDGSATTERFIVAGDA